MFKPGDFVTRVRGISCSWSPLGHNNVKVVSVYTGRSGAVCLELDVPGKRNDWYASNYELVKPAVPEIWRVFNDTGGDSRGPVFKSEADAVAYAMAHILVGFTYRVGQVIMTKAITKPKPPEPEAVVEDV